MRASDFLLIASGVLSMTVTASATTHYVNLNNPAPVAPYTSWATAATDIQAAVDAAAAGDEIVVTNGTYASGGRAVYGAMTNRVAIDKAVMVHSVNGPLVTIIEGGAAPGATNGNGSGAVRCAYVGTNAVLSGFTLTNGHTLTTGYGYKEGCGGGAWCEVSGVVTNCTLSGNWAGSGGGAYSGTLNNCMLSGNSATSCGGGAFYGTLNNCTLSGNSANYDGGGAYSSTLNNCVLSGNSADYDGGGAHYGTLNSCMLRSNSASGGGGAARATLNNCTLSGNSASSGGGACSGTLNNCTLTGNSALSGGGTYSATLYNCIVYYNIAPNGSNYTGGDSKFNYCCTVPLPPGTGNIDAEPLLASLSHLSEQSPCIGRGSNAYSSGLDIDGERWLDPPCIGADQFVRGQATGALSLAIDATYTNIASGFAVSFTALNEGRISASVWDFGDGTVVSNRVYASHAWVTPGLYTVRLTGYNNGWPGGVSTTLQVRVGGQSVYYVNAASTTPVHPYTNWAGAAANIQDAIDAGTQIGRLVLVANGVYKTGGRAVYGTMTNRVVVTEGVEVRSVNGPLVTTIEGQTAPSSTNGDGAIRCVYVGSSAVLSGFTLTNGHTRAAGDIYKEQNGGGAWCEVSGVVTNCTLSGNSAKSDGGGACSGTLNDCALSRNSASCYGGGAHSALLNNCRLSGNSASYGGGTAYGTLNNCTLIGNSANSYASSGGGAFYGTLNNCTLSGNSANSGGGAAYGTLNNCTLSGNSADRDGGGASSCTLIGCTLSGNSASSGGGAYSGTLYNCTLSGNSAEYNGGGVDSGTLNNCALSGNLAHNEGGGAYYGTLNNCTLGENSASYGGGVSSGTLTNCILSGNSASSGGGAYYGTLNNCTLNGNLVSGSGGGAYCGTLYNCALSGNSARSAGGGAYSGTLYNCTLSGNSANSYGGGVSQGILKNCIVYYNLAPNGSNYYGSSSKLNYCCTVPLPSGRGNTEGAPGFVDTNGWSNLRLQTNSPCINAGANGYVFRPTDLDGSPRIVGSTVDMGAYEFQSPASTISYGWLQQYGLPTDGLADFADSDADGLNNWQEWVAGTDPTNSASALRMLTVSPATNTPNRITVRWTSVTNRTYCLERASVMGAAPGFGIVGGNISGLNNTTTFTDTSATGPGPFFYRVRVEN